MSDYTLLWTYPSIIGCKSHTNIDLPPNYFFGNTNWKKEDVDPLHIKFTCLQCGEERMYRRNTEKTIL